MNYKRIYNEIIANARLRNHKDGYTETHHVLPKSMGGKDDSSNLVSLTAREHYLAHYCLAKFCVGNDKSSMVYAFNMMNTTRPNTKGYVNSKLYVSLKEEYSILNRNRVTSEETKKKISLAQKGIPKGPFTNSHKANISASRLGDDNPFYGKKHTKEVRTSISKNNGMKDPINKLECAIKKLEGGIKRNIKGYAWHGSSYMVQATVNGVHMYFGRYKKESEARMVSLRERKKHLRNLKVELKRLLSKKI